MSLPMQERESLVLLPYYVITDARKGITSFIPLLCHYRCKERESLVLFPYYVITDARKGITSFIALLCHYLCKEGNHQFYCPIMSLPMQERESLVLLPYYVITDARKGITSFTGLLHNRLFVIKQLTSSKYTYFRQTCDPWICSQTLSTVLGSLVDQDVWWFSLTRGCILWGN